MWASHVHGRNAFSRARNLHRRKEVKSRLALAPEELRKWMRVCTAEPWNLTSHSSEEDLRPISLRLSSTRMFLIICRSCCFTCSHARGSGLAALAEPSGQPSAALHRPASTCGVASASIHASHSFQAPDSRKMPITSNQTRRPCTSQSTGVKHAAHDRKWPFSLTHWPGFAGRPTCSRPTTPLSSSSRYASTSLGSALSFALLRGVA